MQNWVIKTFLWQEIALLCRMQESGNLQGSERRGCHCLLDCMCRVHNADLWCFSRSVLTEYVCKLACSDYKFNLSSSALLYQFGVNMLNNNHYTNHFEISYTYISGYFRGKKTWIHLEYLCFRVWALEVWFPFIWEPILFCFLWDRILFKPELPLKEVLLLLP